MERLKAFDELMEKNANADTKFPMCQSCMSFHRSVFELEGLPPTYGLCNGCYHVRCTLLELSELKTKINGMKSKINGMETILSDIKTMLECAPPPVGSEYLVANTRFKSFHQ